MIEVSELSKRYGSRVAVESVSFAVRPGQVTGFLGPNGSGKTTTMRMVLGLCRPDRGCARVDGRAYRDLRRPLRTVGALLDAADAFGGRTARAHLTMLAASNGIGRRRVDAVLDLVRLSAGADQWVGGFSLGMRQRLGIAAALLGDPATLLLDEPTNGLDTDGIRWLRRLLRQFADEGRSVLLSSHQMSEMELLADHLLVIRAGRLVADEPLARFVGRRGAGAVRVRAQAPERLVAALRAAGAAVDGTDPLNVIGLSAAEVGAVAAREGVALRELTHIGPSLEDIFVEVIGGAA